VRLAAHDLHFTFVRGANRLKGFDASGALLLNVECRNRTVRDGTYSHWGNCPPGTFLLGDPATRHTPAFGKWFVPLLDWQECRAMAAYRRSGIGIHGGGSGLVDPFALNQSPPWVVTHGCLRLRNSDLDEVVHYIHRSQGVGGACYITVQAPVPGAADADDDYLEVPEDQLAPGE
jgi:hypothetical protein